MTYAIVGGREFDEGAVSDYLDGLPAGSTVVTGDGPGLERFVQTAAAERGMIVRVPEKTDAYTSLWGLDEVIEFYGNLFITGTRRVKRKLNHYPEYVTDQVIAAGHGGTLVIVGKGTHAERARKHVAKASWPNLTVVEL